MTSKQSAGQMVRERLAALLKLCEHHIAHGPEASALWQAIDELVNAPPGTPGAPGTPVPSTEASLAKFATAFVKEPDAATQEYVEAFDALAEDVEQLRQDRAALYKAPYNHEPGEP